MLDDDVASRGPASPARLEQPSQGAIGRRVMTRPTGRAVGRLSCRNCPGCRTGLGATRESRCATCSRPLSAGRRPPPDPERTSATAAHSSIGAAPSRANHTDAGTRRDPHSRMAGSDRNHPSDRNRTTAKELIGRTANLGQGCEAERGNHERCPVHCFGSNHRGRSALQRPDAAGIRLRSVLRSGRRR
jgi:hypothetical protein